MKKLLDFLRKNNFMSELMNAFLLEKAVHINNTNEENALMMLMQFFEHNEQTIFLITPNLYKAQLIYDKLCQVFDSEKICFFPQDEFITNELLVSSMEFRVERINTIKRILSDPKRIVISNLYGILKPELPRKKWKESIITLSQGKDYSLHDLTERLINYGYKKEYTVEKIGDFAVRGGIVDIYPLGCKNPFRLDFFGDTLDIIKEFDIDTQMSIGKTDEVSFLPMVEFFYDEKDIDELEHIINEKKEQNHFSTDTIDMLKRDLENLRNHDELDRLIRYMPFLTDRHYTILDLVETKHLFFLDYHRILEQNNILIEEIKDWYLGAGDYPKMQFSMMYDLNEVFINPSVMIDYLEYKYSDNHRNISVFGKEVLTYSDNLELLYRELKRYFNKKTQVISFSEVASRDKFTAILNDKEIPYLVISDNDSIQQNKINILLSNRMFDIDSDSFEIHVITEEAISKKYISRKRGEYVSVYRKSQRLNDINDLEKGDFVVHYDYGIGKFLEIKTLTFGNVTNDYIHIEYRGGDKLYVSLDAIDQVHKYSGSEGFSPRLSKLGGQDWNKAKKRVREQVQEIADQLIKLYSEREQSIGFIYDEYPEIEHDFQENFPYNETPDQLKTITEVFNDMSKTTPMDRLICGDVGFGKTEVAMRAAFRAVLNGKQVAYLAPTTVLSKQHYKTFKERMDEYGVNVELLNRFITKKHQNDILSRLKLGSVDILIGTHRILSDDVGFKNLGLLVIDEEQRFGVLHKEKIKELKVNIDVISLSATPIPRTLHMAIMGVKNMSLLETAPENRYPIQTYVLERNDIIIKDAIERELARKGQVFYLYNRVDDIDFIADKLQNLIPEARMDIAHGKMRKIDLERVVDSFVNQELDVLISTTIIETGIDIPNANTLIVHDADLLGLSQLYQIRGRVGRSDKIAYAYLMYKKNKILTEEAEKRLKVIKEFTELGSGFKIAVRDLSIRGAGDVLGKEQSGFMDSVGIDMYMKILEEEVEKVQNQPEIKKLKRGVKAHVSRFIDDKYIEDDYVKIEMHKRIKTVKSIEETYVLLEELRDRFGNYDAQLEIYIYEKLFEYLTQEIQVEKILENKTNITLILSIEGTASLAGDDLFKTGMEMSKYIRFAYKKERIHIILDTIKLDRHWLYTMVDFLQQIVKLRKT
ncbi:MAG: transcription-repair coupling factor [Bacilli bacterium]|nr:transcription-repair coupling factor [Bacilli bacterium]